MKTELEVVAADGNRCGEAPLWDDARGRLLWTDIDGGKVYQLDPGSGERSVLSDGPDVAGIALNETGELVFAGSEGLHLWREGKRRALLAELEGQPVPLNDILAAPHGRLYAGTYYWDETGMRQTGELLLVEPDGRARAVAEGIELANGLALSPDGRTLYFADSAARRIYAYDVDAATGDLSGERILAQVPMDEGIPDGLTVDEEGFLWCAQWYGAQVVRYDPEGKVERRVSLPVTQVSSVAFGGADLTDLYITTAADHWESDLTPVGYDPSLPTGGSLYRLRPGVRGRPEYRARFAW